MYVFTMKQLFIKISVELTKKPSPKERKQSLLHAIGGVWHVNKLGQKLPPLNKSKSRKIAKKRRMK